MKTTLKSLAALALLAGVMLAQDRGKDVRAVDLREAPLSEALKKVEAATGRTYEALPADVEGKTLTFVKTGTADEIAAAFAAALEAKGLALLPGKDGAQRLHAFKVSKAIAMRPVSRGRRLSVKVVEGSVALVGDRGRVTVRAGEKSFVASGALPENPTPCDPATVAAWRFDETLPAAGLQASIPLQTLKIRFIGTSETGKPIIEYELEGGTHRFAVGELNAEAEAQGMDPKKAILEGEDLVLPIRIKVKTERGDK